MSNQPTTTTNPRHRAAGHVGSFTVHAPEDYRPRHAQPTTTAHYSTAHDTTHHHR